MMSTITIPLPANIDNNTRIAIERLLRVINEQEKRIRDLESKVGN